jgi:hypothetical protein
MAFFHLNADLIDADIEHAVETLMYLDLKYLRKPQFDDAVYLLALRLKLGLNNGGYLTDLGIFLGALGSLLISGLNLLVVKTLVAIDALLSFVSSAFHANSTKSSFTQANQKMSVFSNNGFFSQFPRANSFIPSFQSASGARTSSPSSRVTVTL